jgi:para-nitrobenzyl esterase
VVPKLPAEVYRTGQEIGVPLIIGNNARERSIQGGPDAVTKAIQDYYGALSAKAMEIYGAKAPAHPPHGDTGSQFQTDNMFRCGATVIAAWHGSKNPTWEYEFSQAYEPRGAVHSWELQYVFGMLGNNATQPVDRKISDQVQEYWTNFSRPATRTAEPSPRGRRSMPSDRTWSLPRMAPSPKRDCAARLAKSFSRRWSRRSRNRTSVVRPKSERLSSTHPRT